MFTICSQPVKTGCFIFATNVHLPFTATGVGYAHITVTGRTTVDCVDLETLGAAPAPKWRAANDNGIMTAPPARARRRSRARLELLH